MTFPLLQPAFPYTQSLDAGAGQVFIMPCVPGVANSVTFLPAPAAGMNYYVSLLVLQLLTPGVCNGRLDLIISGHTSLTHFVEYTAFSPGVFANYNPVMFSFGLPLALAVSEQLDLTVTSTTSINFTCRARARVYYSTL